MSIRRCDNDYDYIKMFIAEASKALSVSTEDLSVISSGVGGREDESNGTSFCLYKGNKISTLSLPLATWDGIVVVGQFSLTPMAGCCGIQILHSMGVYSPYKNKGLGKKMTALAVEMSKAQGYGMLICTDKASNTYQRRILKRVWSPVDSFINPRTSNAIILHTISLTDRVVSSVWSHTYTGNI